MEPKSVPEPLLLPSNYNDIGVARKGYKANLFFNWSGGRVLRQDGPAPAGNPLAALGHDARLELSPGLDCHRHREGVGVYHAVFVQGDGDMAGHEKQVAALRGRFAG